MRKIKSFSSIWKVEGWLYNVGDMPLLQPVRYAQLAWFASALIFMLLFGALPPFCFIKSGLVKFGVIPIGLAWFMNTKTFDGKKPFAFLRSAALYLVRSKQTYLHKAVSFGKEKIGKRPITMTRSGVYEKTIFE